MGKEEEKKEKPVKGSTDSESDPEVFTLDASDSIVREMPSITSLLSRKKLVVSEGSEKLSSTRKASSSSQTRSDSMRVSRQVAENMFDEPPAISQTDPDQNSQKSASLTHRTQATATESTLKSMPLPRDQEATEIPTGSATVKLKDSTLTQTATATATATQKLGTASNEVEFQGSQVSINFDLSKSVSLEVGDDARVTHKELDPKMRNKMLRNQKVAQKKAVARKKEKQKKIDEEQDKLSNEAYQPTGAIEVARPPSFSKPPRKPKTPSSSRKPDKDSTLPSISLEFETSTQAESDVSKSPARKTLALPVRKAGTRPQQIASEHAPLIFWKPSRLRRSSDPIGQALTRLMDEGVHGALFLVISRPPAGFRLPVFKATAAVGAHDKEALWTGLTWNPETIKDLWRVFVKRGVVELPPLEATQDSMLIDLKLLKLVRTAFGVSKDEWLTLVRAGPAKKCRGVLALISNQSVKKEVRGVKKLMSTVVKKKSQSEEAA